MSFEKAQQLLELATFVASHRAGVTLDDVGERFGISKRTSQRILHALEAQFPDTESGFDEDGHKRWRLQTGALRDLLTLTSDELAALDLAIETLERNALGVPERASCATQALTLIGMQKRLLAPSRRTQNMAR
jgi:predicted DNA-binding transcriptional regulator YafY